MGFIESMLGTGLEQTGWSEADKCKKGEWETQMGRKTNSKHLDAFSLRSYIQEMSQVISNPENQGKRSARWNEIK